MKLHIRNMVCDRCKMVVRSELEQLGYEVISVTLGEAEVKGDIVVENRGKISNRFRRIGFELIENKHDRLIERVKTLLIELVHHKGEEPKTNVSGYLMQHIPLEYNYLSNLFSESECITIEKFLILQKTERVKELLTYGELSLSEIADHMGYSSVAYLSAQFKKVTGQTPTQFKEAASRQSLDLLNTKN